LAETNAQLQEADARAAAAQAQAELFKVLLAEMYCPDFWLSD